MRALFLQHDPGSRPGLIGRALQQHGFDVEVLPMSERVDDGSWRGAFPAVGDHDLLIPLGAIWSLNDRNQVGTWIDRELELLREADARGVPVLGICFGGQALAAAHGGRVQLAPRPEVGWTSVQSDDVELVPPGPWMQWHSDGFVVPPEATEIARNEVGPQAFRLRRNLAVQFHPEVDPDNIAWWIELGGEVSTAALAAADTTAHAVLDDAHRHHDRAEADVARLVARFLDDVAGFA